MKKNHDYHDHALDTVIDYTTWQDLHLVKGTKASPETYLAAKIDRTSTEIGKVILFSMVAQPALKELPQKQAIVRELVKSPALFNQLDELLKNLSDKETLVLSLFQTEAFHYLIKSKEIKIPWASGLEDVLNRSSVLADVNERLALLRDVLLTGSQLGATVVLPLQGIALMAKYTQKTGDLKDFALNRLGMSPVMSFFTTLGLSTWLLKQVVWNRWTEGANSIATGFNYGSFCYYSIDMLQANIVLLRYLQNMLANFARYIEAMQSLEKLVSSNPTLKKNLPIIDAIRHVFTTTPATCPEFQEFLDLMQTSTFTDEFSFTSYLGRILVAYRLAHEHKEKFVPALIALGYLDACMSIARLYKEGEGKTASWCFAHCKEDSDTPILQATGFWNPFVNPKTAVTNSISMGTNGNPRTLLLTGPNAGGKSTAIIALVICAILGLGIGLAPALEFVCSRLMQIMTCLNIIDDIAAGNSHFKAGVLRAQELVNMPKNLKENEFCLTAVDEIFNDTTYDEGEAAAYSLIDTLGRHPNNLCLTATHFPIITTLEEETKGHYFKN